MQALAGMAWLLGLQMIGELLARGLALPFPGPVVGMMLMLVALRSGYVRAQVSAVAEYLLSHLSLLFVPIAVGVTAYLPILQDIGATLLVVLVASTWIGLAITALSLRWLLKDSDA